MADRPSLKERYEQGIPHDPRSKALYKHIDALDFKDGGDFFGFKHGGEGDNGEHLMYLMDDYFASLDAQNPRQAEFEGVAKKVILDTIEHIDYYSQCPFCECGTDDGDGGTAPHSADCSLHGFDLTQDITELEEWAKK